MHPARCAQPWWQLPSGHSHLCPTGGDADINRRVNDLKKGLTLRKALVEVNSFHAHDLGTAVAAVRPKLDGPSRAAARATQRRANRARHEPFSSGPSAGESGESSAREPEEEQVYFDLFAADVQDQGVQTVPATAPAAASDASVQAAMLPSAADACVGAAPSAADAAVQTHDACSDGPGGNRTEAVRPDATPGDKAKGDRPAARWPQDIVATFVADMNQHGAWGLKKVADAELFCDTCGRAPPRGGVYVPLRDYRRGHIQGFRPECLQGAYPLTRQGSGPRRGQGQGQREAEEAVRP